MAVAVLPDASVAVTFTCSGWRRWQQQQQQQQGASARCASSIVSWQLFCKKLIVDIKLQRVMTKIMQC
jgi:hypothetical protein